MAYSSDKLNDSTSTRRHVVPLPPYVDRGASACTHARRRIASAFPPSSSPQRFRCFAPPSASAATRPLPCSSSPLLSSPLHHHHRRRRNAFLLATREGRGGGGGDIIYSTFQSRGAGAHMRFRFRNKAAGDGNRPASSPPNAGKFAAPVAVGGGGAADVADESPDQDSTRNGASRKTPFDLFSPLSPLHGLEFLMISYVIVVIN